MSRSKHLVLAMGLAMNAAHLAPLVAAERVAFPDPKDWSAWEQYRHTVRHPATLIQAEDLERAQENLRQHAWARAYRDRIRSNADSFVEMLSAEYIANMAEVTTPGCTGPCPACRDKGLRWHPNGQWTWSFRHPDQLTCGVCSTVYPNETYPESIVLRSTWDPRQQFTFYGGDTFVCFGYKQARPTFTGIIRAKKLNFLTGQLHTLALAYALGGDIRHAQAARAILLRLAEVLPSYLVRAGYGYGEFSDCDPHLACEQITNLPTDELVYPPNKPDRKLHTGYWSASRIGSSGMDGGWVSRVTQAYDLTCEAGDQGGPVYSPEERLRIERDVLLEGSYLAACDTSINNKSVGNRAGAAMVGLCVGHPGLVRFGLDGFVQTVDDWFLPDGGTSESAAYAMMTMGGIRPFGLAFRSYSEPPGFSGPDGSRLQDFNACRDTRYGTCWQALLWTLQGNLRHPPLADSYRTTGISASYAELIALAYPSDEHRSFLAEVAGEAPGGSAAEAAIFYRDPQGAAADLPAFALPDVVFPFLSQGYIRLGEHGRGGALVLDASDWGGHHHRDSLNLYLWKDGHELLSDLGYLWDHPDKPMTYRTVAHNLVMIDGKEQERKGRGGSFHLFAATPRISAMEASSQAYPEADVYRRTCIQVAHTATAAYVVDLFRAAGGERRDWVCHGPNLDLSFQGIAPRPLDNNTPLPGTPAPSKGLSNPRGARSSAAWSAQWKVAANYHFTLWVPPAADTEEIVTVWDGWGQRDHRNSDRDALLPYLFRSRSGRDQLDTFVSVWEGAAAGQAVVRGVRCLPPPPDCAPGTVILAVDTHRGTDLVLSQPARHEVSIEVDGHSLHTDAQVAVVSLHRDGSIPFAGMIGGARLTCGDMELNTPTPVFSGTIAGTGSDRGASWFEVQPPLPSSSDMRGSVLLVSGEDKRERAYPIRRQEALPHATRLYTEDAHSGFPAHPAATWRLNTVTAFQAP